MGDLKFINVINEYSLLCLAVRVGRHHRLAKVIYTIYELFELYPAPMGLRMDNDTKLVTTTLPE